LGGLLLSSRADRLNKSRFPRAPPAAGSAQFPIRQTLCQLERPVRPFCGIRLADHRPRPACATTAATAVRPPRRTWATPQRWQWMPPATSTSPTRATRTSGESTGRAPSRHTWAMVLAEQPGGEFPPADPRKRAAHAGLQVTGTCPAIPMGLRGDRFVFPSWPPSTGGRELPRDYASSLHSVA
jgi:hypothetical protein